MRILSPYLKRVEFLGFERDKWKLDIAQLLLEHKNTLEKMVFSWCNEVDYHEKTTVTLNGIKISLGFPSVELITLLKNMICVTIGSTYSYYRVTTDFRYFLETFILCFI